MPEITPSFISEYAPCPPTAAKLIQKLGHRLHPGVQQMIAGAGAALERFGRAMRENITTRDIPFRKAWLRSIIERIEVDDGGIRIIGDKSTLEQAVDGKLEASGGVRRSVPRWHAQRESNPCLHRERVMS